MKVCSEPGCPELQVESRCLTHRREVEAKRGSRQARGYDAGYDQHRRHDIRQLNAGAVLNCWRCGQPVPAHDYSLGHCDDDRSIVHGAEHLRNCNLANTRGGCPHHSHAA